MANYDSGVPRRSKYRRSRRDVSWVGLVIGLALGVGAGLFYAWTLDTRVEFDTDPWQLKAQDRAEYIAAITLSYAYDGNLNRALQRLIALRSQGDPIQEVANVACELATTGYASSTSGLRAIRSMMLFYQLQGRAGCADNLIAAEQEATPVVVIDVPSPTPLPPASKTPTPAGAAGPTASPPRVVIPTGQPQSEYEVVGINTFCDTQNSGVIEVFVQDFSGDGVPGETIRVRWDEGEDTFFSGLKPERGPGYADFQMEADKAYIVEMPGRSDPTAQPLVAAPCSDESGDAAIISYRVFFRQV